MGRWPQKFDRLWESLQKRHATQPGTLRMIELLLLGREHGQERLRAAIAQALSIGCTDAAAVRYLMHAAVLDRRPVAPLNVTAISALAQYERAMPVVTDYDRLLVGCARQEVVR